MSVGLSSEFKKDYNRQLERFYKADKYLKTCSKTELEKWLPEMIKITNYLSLKMQVAQNMGHEMSDEEILNGF